MTDRRLSAQETSPGSSGSGGSTSRSSEQAAPTEQTPPAKASYDQPDPSSEEIAPEENPYLDDLRRLQAEFDNFRKRSLRDQTVAGDRAAGRVIEELLPVLDNFERAIAHGEGGEGVQLVFKDFKTVLERLGLEEVPAEGASFDPNIHEAVESRHVEGLEEPVIIEVYRRGYLHKGQLLRAATVVVGRPAEPDAVESEQGAGA